MDGHKLHSIETEIENLEDANGMDYISADAKSHLIKLEIERDRILKDRENTQRLWSRAI